MLTAADVGLVTNVMKGINAPESLIQSIRTLLTTNSDGLGGTKLIPVGTNHFGGSTNGHRLGVNAQMAHQEAEQEFQKLADSLRAYSDAIKLWADDVRDVDGSTNAEMTTRAAALAQVNDTIDQARDQSSSSTMGDGQYTEPPAAGDGA
ncbi:hypothetical protein [Nocardioides sp. P5_E3]